MEKKKMLVRTDPRVIMPEGFGQAKPPPPPAAGAPPAGPSAVTIAAPVSVKSLHNFLANLQYDTITHFRREKYLSWPTWAADVECDTFVVPRGVALVLTCVRYRATTSYTIAGVGKVVYYLQDEALLPFYLVNPPPARAIRTTINGSTIASQQFIYADPVPPVPPALPDTVVDGYYTLNQNIIPPGYSMQTIATENQMIKTLLSDGLPMRSTIADFLEHFGVEYYGFTLPMTVWNKFKQEYAP